MSIPADFTKLIQALAEANQLESLEAQFALLECALVSMELNPDPAPFYDTRHALATLNRLNLAKREWLETDEALADYFTPQAA